MARYNTTGYAVYHGMGYLHELTSTFSLRYAGRFVALAGAYFVTAEFGLHFYGVDFTALIWPPVGIALAALFLWGYALWPAAALGAFVFALSVGASPVAALGIVAGGTLEVLFGAYFLREIVKLNPTFGRVRDALSVIATSVIAPIIGATVGVAGFVLNGTLALEEVPQTWLSWWLGDALAILVFVPFLIFWFEKPYFTRTRKQLIEGVAAFGLLFLASGFVFFGPFIELRGVPLRLVSIPLLWIALRMGLRGLTFASVCTALLALHGDGNLFSAQLFVATATILFLIVTSAIEERNEARRLLEARMRGLEQSLKKMNVEDQAKVEFLAILAHELRNPLSPIVSAIELIRINGIRPENSALFETIVTHVKTISRLLDDLLDISRISRKKFHLQKESVELQSVINHSLETVRPFVKEHQLTLETFIPGEPIWLNGDPTRLTQAFVNILYNAAKYTNQGGKITVICRNESGFVQVAIQDTGVGIEPHMLGKIFELFVQAKDASPTVGTGLGIGLALTKRLVELHDGTISVISEGKGKGSTFTVVLPKPSQLVLPKQPPQEEEIPLVAKEKYTILVVDDNAVAAHSLQKLLEYSGHHVGAVHNGKETFEYFHQHNPKVVILDIGLPDISGYEIAERLRKEQDPSLLLIALSGYGQKEDKEKAAEAGFDYHLTKPVGIKDIEVLFIEHQTTHK